jgi:large subunit ribosomal protein L28
MSRSCSISEKKPMFGHNVSHANNKTKRRFNPNVHWVRVPSQTLGQTLSLKLSTQGMRTLDKHGGLDAFLTAMPPRRLSGDLLRLKKSLMKKTSASASSKA